MWRNETQVFLPCKSSIRACGLCGHVQKKIVLNASRIHVPSCFNMLSIIKSLLEISQSIEQKGNMSTKLVEVNDRNFRISYLFSRRRKRTVQERLHRFIFKKSNETAFMLEVSLEYFIWNNYFRRRLLFCNLSFLFER